VGWIGPAVHLSKGCYRGQEAVARVHNLGHPPRRLALLHLDGSDETMPEHGAPVLVDGREVGWVGTSAWHYELGLIATAVLKRTTPVDGPLLVRASAGEVAASSETVVLP
jgi:folate-binding Fe-S cluster repair protein YgfZ